MALLIRALAGALDEGHRLDLLAVGGALEGPAVGGLGQALQLEVGHHVRRLAVGEFRQEVGVVGLVIGGLDDGAKVLGDRAAGLDADVGGEAPRGAAGLGDLGVEVDLDLRIGLDRGDHLRHARLLGLGQGRGAGVGDADRGSAEGHALVEVLVDPAQFTLVAHQVDAVAGLGRLQGGGHGGDAIAHHHQGAVEGLLTGTAGLGHEADLGAGHAHIVVRHLLGGLLVLVTLGPQPDDALAQVGAGHGHLGETEGLDLSSPRASGDHDVGSVTGGDVVADQLHALGGAQHGVLLAGGHLALAGGDLDELPGVQALTDTAAGAKIAGEFLVCCHGIKPPLRRRRERPGWRAAPRQWHAEPPGSRPGRRRRSRRRRRHHWPRRPR